MVRDRSLLLVLVLSACSSVAPATPERYAKSSAPGSDGFAAAVALVEGKHYAEAVPLLRRELGGDPRLEDYHLYYLGVAEARSGDSSHALSRFIKLRTQHPKSVWSSATALELGRLYRQQGKTEEAEAFLAVAANAPDK